jgi:hypothetical protein
MTCDDERTGITFRGQQRAERLIHGCSVSLLCSGVTGRDGAEMSSFPCLVRLVSWSDQVRYRLGERLVDRYLEFVAGRCRPNTLRAVAFDLKAFFAVVPRLDTALSGDPMRSRLRRPFPGIALAW